MKKLSELSPAFHAAIIYIIAEGNDTDLDSIKPMLIDGTKNSTGHDLALFFRNADSAFAYKARYPSLGNLDVFEATVAEMIEIFNAKVEYFTFGECFLME